MHHHHWSVSGVCLVSALLLGCCSVLESPALDSDGRQYYEQVRLIMTGDEERMFARLPDRASREEFMTAFWARRDPDPATEDNEFKAEFLRRVEFANARFREGVPGWSCDRGRMYIVLGQPDEVEDRSAFGLPEAGSSVVWRYGRRLTLTFVDKYGEGRYMLDVPAGVRGDLPAAIQRAKSAALGEAVFERPVEFKLRLPRGREEVLVSIPVASLVFKAKAGKLVADFEFVLRLLDLRAGRIRSFTESRRFEAPEDDVRMLKSVDFVLPLSAEAGDDKLEVIVDIRPAGIKSGRTIRLPR